MEKRIGTVIIQVERKDNVQKMNDIISLILEGTTDQIGSLTGQLGRLDGIQVKSALLKNKDDE